MNIKPKPTPMLTDLLDLLTPEQMFDLLNYCCVYKMVPARNTVKCWMLDNGFTLEQLRD